MGAVRFGGVQLVLNKWENLKLQLGVRAVELENKEDVSYFGW